MAKRAKTAAKTVKKKAVRKTAKKATRKAPKKAAARKTTRRKAARKPARKTARKTTKPKEKLEVYHLGRDAPGERYFILANGKPVKHVAELAEIMDDIEDHVFAHHVNPERNDFHTWVKEVFQDVELAKKILGVDHQKELQLVIYKHAAHKSWR